MMWDLVVVGGGAAGIFGAVAAKKRAPEARVLVLEKSGALLSKVRISGGGRCNVTHGCFDLRALVQNYPRGSKELLGPFHVFGPRETMQWFTERGVELKIEADGRVFPVSDKSSSIIDALLEEARSLGVVIETKKGVSLIEPGFRITLKEGEVIESHSLLLATGSSKEGHALAASLGHTIDPLVPSLFTFNVPNSPLKELSGISVQDAKVTLEDSNLSTRGPVLITHFGFSGPAILRLSAFGAHLFATRSYKTSVKINWIPSFKEGEIVDVLRTMKEESPQKLIGSVSPFSLPKNLWKELVGAYIEMKFLELSEKAMREIAQKLAQDRYQIDGKTTHKEEFVTAGGVNLKEIDFKTMQSKKVPKLFFAGEVLDIDGVTGGFNFQNAWTGGFIAGTTAGEFALAALHSD